MGTQPLREQTFTRRAFLMYQAMMQQQDYEEAEATVTAISDLQPDLDMDEELTWQQWHEHDAALDSA